MRESRKLLIFQEWLSVGFRQLVRGNPVVFWDTVERHGACNPIIIESLNGGLRGECGIGLGLWGDSQSPFFMSPSQKSQNATGETLKSWRIHTPTNPWKIKRLREFLIFWCMG